MESWLYIFSKFTPEAILLEALVIFFLICLFTLHWVLKKRRYGSAGPVLPSGPVKVYLGELILSAEKLRTQLFGIAPAEERLLYELEAQSQYPGPEVGAGTSKRLDAIEKKLNDQMAILEKLSSQGVMVQGMVPGAGVGEGAPAGGPANEELVKKNKALEGDIKELNKTIEGMETRLTEYSIIEDDLANLKRIQQENAQLKAQLKAAQAGGGGGPPPSDTPPAAGAAAGAAPAAAPAAPPAAAAAAEPPAGAQALPAAPDAAADAPKKDEDSLVAEFERMLNG